MPQVVYARVPDALKEATDRYAELHGSSITTAVVDLLSRGLEAAADQESVAQLRAEIAQVRAEKAQSEAKLQGALAELSALQVLSQRSALRIGACPSCGKDVTGFDLLATGCCSACDHPLGDLLSAQSLTPGLDQKEFLLLIGALGALLGVAWLATREQ